MSKKSKVSIRQALGVGWETVKSNLGYVMGVELLMLLIVGLAPMLIQGVVQKSIWLTMVFALAMMVVRVTVEAGWKLFFIRFVDGVRPEVELLFEPWKQFFTLVWANFRVGLWVLVYMLGLLVVLGLGAVGMTVLSGVLGKEVGGLISGVGLVVWLVVLAVAVVNVSLRFMFVMYVVVDRKVGAGEALGESTVMTKGNKWKLLGFCLAMMGVNLLGLLCLVVGLLVSIPVSQMAVAYMYRELGGGKKALSV